MRLIMLKDLVSHSISPTLGDFGPQQWVQGAQHPPPPSTANPNTALLQRDSTTQLSAGGQQTVFL